MFGRADREKQEFEEYQEKREKENLSKSDVKTNALKQSCKHFKNNDKFQYI